MVKYLAVILATATLTACTTSAFTQITNAAGATCEAVFVAIDPALGPPLCTTAVEIANAIESLVTANQSTAVGATLQPITPTNADVYNWLKAHGQVSATTSHK